MTSREPPRPAPPAAPKETASPRSILVGLWLVGIVLALYHAGEIRARVAASAWLGSQSWALSLAHGLVGAAELTRVADGRALVEEWKTDATPDAVWLKRPHAPPPARPPQEPAPQAPAALAAKEAVPPREALLPARAQVQRVLLVGESSIQINLGPEMERRLRTSYRNVKVLRFGKLSTSLTRPDVLDWPAKTKELIEQFHPDLVVAQFGGNDAQGMVLPGGRVLAYGTPEWDEEYRARVRAIVTLATSNHARIAMLGMPIMRDEKLSAKMQHVNGLIARETEAAGGLFVSTWDLSTDARGGYRADVKVDGTSGLMRDVDGVHYTRLGSDYVSRRILRRLEQHFVLVPKSPALAVAVRHDVPSRHRAGGSTYLAYVPQRAAFEAGSRVPLLFVFQSDAESAESAGGDGARGAAYAEHAHAALQEAASTHDVVIVTPSAAEPPALDPSWRAHFVDEVVPAIEAALPVSRRRAISAGPHAAPAILALAEERPDAFERVTAFEATVREQWAAEIADHVASVAPGLHEP